MKRTTLFITLLLLIVGCSKPEPINLGEMLIEREGHYFRKDTNKPYSGPVFSLYRDGQKKEEGILKKGYFDGKHIYWYENGQKRKEGTYKDGKEDGLWTYWDTDGSKYEGKVIRKDDEDGKFLYWNDYEKTKIESHKTYKNGKKDGLWTYWYENGQYKFKVTYKDGLPIVEGKQSTADSLLAKTTHFIQPVIIDLVTAKTFYDRGVLFINASTGKEHREGHIAGSKLAPGNPGEILRWAREDDPLVTYCNGGECDLSVMFSNALMGEDWGFTRVFVFYGGLPQWIEAGYPVE